MDSSCHNYSTQYRKPITEMKHLSLLEYEFTYKVAHDFRKYLFLSLKENLHMSIDTFFDSDFSYEGYEKHKVIKYHTKEGERILHIYLKYKTCFDAMKARQHYRAMDKYNAEIVDDILKSWYSYEVMCGMPGETVGVLDTIGQAKFNNPLTFQITSNILMPFGNPRILGISNDKVDVAFSSMAEAIAACIALGQWFFKSQPQDSKFYYRLLLNKSERFAFLVNKCSKDKTANNAYKLDYFVPSNETTEKPAIQTCENLMAGQNSLHFNSNERKSNRREKFTQRTRPMRPRYSRYNVQNCSYINTGISAVNPMSYQVQFQSPNLIYCTNPTNAGCG